MQPKIAVIIPVYNTEKYLHQCLTSAINQTLQEIEIIIVNDASTDSSLEIIQEFKKKDSRIQLINFTNNKGNGVGRNTAIEKATAEFILFLDSDDWLEKKTAELTYYKAKVSDYQVIIFGFTEHYHILRIKKNNKREDLPHYKEGDPNFYKYLLMNRKGLYSMPWIYLFSRTLLVENKVVFSEGIYFEDIIFVAKALYHIDKIGVINTIPLYNYRIRKNSIVQSTSKKKIDDLYTAHVYLKDFLKEKNIYKKYQEEYLISFLLFCVFFTFKNYFKMYKKQRDKELDTFMKNIRKSDLLTKNNLILLIEVSKELESDEKETQKYYKSSFRFLVGIKYNYGYTKLLNKTVYAFQKFLTQKK
jgi:glycosyltransferase involved in cell wall biosynthesis